jgi:hypothetical protein
MKVKPNMLNKRTTLAVLSLTCLLSTAQAERLCTAQNKSIKVSVHSSACQANACIVKFQPGRKAYFEFQPAACEGGAPEFSIQVEKKSSKARPKLASCDGNASCPSRLEANGNTQKFEARGKTWGTISY